MRLLGANPEPRAAGIEPLPGIVNYFIGSDPAKWHTHIPTYGKVQYKDVYPGIDLVYYGTSQRQLEYDFIVAPGADPNQIALTFEGAEKIEVDENGDLVLKVRGTVPGATRGQAPAGPEPVPGAAPSPVTHHSSPLRFKKPIVYQVIDGVRHDLAGSYVLRDASDQPSAISSQPSDDLPHSSRASRSSRPATVGFAVAAYDPNYPLIIDPVLTYSTYLGGTDNDWGKAIAVDGSGNAYVTGFTTSSTNFPTPPVQVCVRGGGCSLVHPLQTNSGGFIDAFVSKFNSSGGLVYSTYLGGSSNEEGLGIAVDGSGQAYVTGVTFSTNFPLMSAFDSTYNNAGDAFVSKLNASGTALVFSTYLGGSGADVGLAIAVEGGATPRVFVAGRTDSSFILGASTTLIGARGGTDAFAARLGGNGTTVERFVFLGGSDKDQANALAIDASGNMYLAGDTNSTNFPTSAQPFQGAYGGPPTILPNNPNTGDAFVVKLDSNAGNLVYGSYLGGGSYETGQGIALDSLGQAIVVGDTKSTNFPTANPLQPTLRGAKDLFVSKVNASGTGLVFSTFLGGSVEESSRGVALDALENIYVLGTTTSEDFPTTADALRRTGIIRQNTDDPNRLRLISNIALAKLSPTGGAVLYGTYFGGTVGVEDLPDGLAVDGAGNASVTGIAYTTDFPLAHPYQASLLGLYDAFVARLGTSCGAGAVDLQVTQTDTPDPFQYGPPFPDDELVYTVTVANLGPSAATGVRLYDLLSEDVTFLSASPGTCGPSNFLVICNLGTIAAGASAVVTVRVSVQGLPFVKNWAQAISSECDPNPTNNAEVETTTISTILAQQFALNVNVAVVGEVGVVSSVNRNGISCPPECSHDYVAGAVVQLSGPEPMVGGVKFRLTSGNRDCRDGILIMTGNRNCSFYVDQLYNGNDFFANFGESVEVGSSAVLPFFADMPNPSATGAVDMSVSTTPPFGIEGPSSFHMEPGQLLRDVAPGIMIRFTPISTGENDGALQLLWSGPGANPSFMATAAFSAIGTGIMGMDTKALTVTRAGTGSGTVTGTGIICGDDCLETYTSDSPPAVTLTAMADAGSVFAGWSNYDPCNGTVSPCQATAPAGVVATFNAAGTLQFSTAAYSVNESGGNATITVTRVNGSAGAVGATVTTSNGTATAGQDYTAVNQAVNFADGDSTSKTVNVPISDDATYEGNETVALALGSVTGGATLGSPNAATLTILENDPAPPQTFTLTIMTKGTGTGTVSSSPAGITCLPGCTSASTAYDPGTQVSLSAAASTGSIFVGWGGACSGLGACQFKMDESKTVKATFRAIPVKKPRPSRTAPSR